MPKKKSIAINKLAVLALLRQRLGDDAIMDPANNPDNQQIYEIKKDELLNLFKKGGCFIDGVIESNAKKWKNTVSLDEFIRFIRYDATTMNLGKFTQGVYHIYMDYIHAMFDICCDNFNDNDNDGFGLPDYSRIMRKDYDLYQVIYPVRMEFMFAWWIMNMTRKFVSKYNYKTEISFQYRLHGKVYDICIEPFDIVIEYQESRSNHTDSSNDVDKKAIVRAEAKIIEYFQEAKYNEQAYEYLEEFWNNILKRRLIQCLLKDKKNNDFINDYLIDEFKSILLQEISILENYRGDNIDNVMLRIKSVSNLISSNESIISLVFKWKHKEREIEKTKNSNTYLISSDDIANLIHITTSSGRKLIIDALNKAVVSKYIKNKCFTNWAGLMVFLCTVDSDVIKIDADVRRSAIDYLIIAEMSYNKVVDELNTYYNDLLFNIMDEVERREQYIVEKYKSQYDKEIKKLTTMGREKDTLIKDLKKTIRMMNTRAMKLKSTSDIHKMKGICADICGLMDRLSFYKESTNDFKIVKSIKVDKPIIRNVPDLIYTGNIKNQVSIEKLKSFFIRYNIPLSFIKKLVKKLCPCAKNPKTVCKIQLNEFEFDEDVTEESEQTTDDEELDDGSSDESDVSLRVEPLSTSDDDGSELDI
jgi:hypothetical protein